MKHNPQITYNIVILLDDIHLEKELRSISGINGKIF